MNAQQIGETLLKILSLLISNEDVTIVTSMSVSEAQLTESTLSDLIVLMVRLGPGEDGNVA